jgi:tetratricopeptide (TPR) repeat protein
MIIFSILAVWLALAIATGFAAQSRDRNGFGWFVLAILISPVLALILLIAFPSRFVGPSKICQFCTSQVAEAALVCPHCHRDIDTPVGIQARRAARGQNYIIAGIVAAVGILIWVSHNYSELAPRPTQVSSPRSTAPTFQTRTASVGVGTPGNIWGDKVDAASTATDKLDTALNQTTMAPAPNVPLGNRNAGPAPQHSNETGGSTFVQVSSQRSETDAQSAFRALQARYSSLLLARVPLITRADTAQGVFYRVFIGPFEDNQQANDFCESFKTIGGQCVVAQFKDPRRSDIADEQNCQARKGKATIDACTRRIASDQTGELLVAAYRHRGVAKIGELDYDGAIADFTQAITLDGRDSLAYSQRGQAYLRKGDYGSSLSDLNKALEINPWNANALTQRSAVYSLTGENDKATADANAALDIYPNSTALKNNRGFAYNNIGEYDRAIVDLNDAIKLDPSNGRAYKNRGISYEKKGDFRRALADYNAAITLDKNEVEAIDGARRVKERIGN